MLLDHTQVMLQEAHLPHYLWTEPAAVACGRRTFAPLVGQEKKPWEVFFGVRPDISTPCPFRCLAYVRLPIEQRQKLHPRALEGAFVGYNRVSAAWYVLVDCRIIVSRGVRSVEGVRRPMSRQ